MQIVAIPEPTAESEARLAFLKSKKLTEELSSEEINEMFKLEMRQFWNCEC